MAHDTVYRGATVYDGSGAPPAIADVAVDGDRIAEVGSVSGVADRVVDASQLALAPGFIDVHTHDDFAAHGAPGHGVQGRCGGVTTCVVGNCGHGGCAAGLRRASFQARVLPPRHHDLPRVGRLPRVPAPGARPARSAEPQRGGT